MEKVFEWTTPEKAIRSEVEFWAQKSVEDRVSAVETLREATLGILAAHGRPRATQDIDFWVEPTKENATRLCKALGEFGFPALALPAFPHGAVALPRGAVDFPHC